MGELKPQVKRRSRLIKWVGTSALCIGLLLFLQVTMAQVLNADYGLKKRLPEFSVTYTDDPRPNQSGSAQVVISEFRLRGPSGPTDEFIEIHNNTNSDHTVAAASGTGYGIAASDGVTRCSIPNGTVIPSRGHFLCANSVSYSLGSYPAGNGTTATPDATYTTDISDNAGIAIFNNNLGGANYNPGSRLDAVGSTSEVNTVYREGTGYSPLTPFNIDYSFYRSTCPRVSSSADPICAPGNSGQAQDTDNNAVDFVFVDTNGTSAGAGQRLGAAGPENLSGPRKVDGSPTVQSSLLDAGAALNASPNFVRDFTSDPPNNSTFGTIALRQKLTNNSGVNVTRLRLRVLDLETFPAASGIADGRPRSSSNVLVNLSGGGTATAVGTTLEQPPSQPNGGGFNSSLSVGTISAGTPLAPGATVNVNLLLGIQQTGVFRYCLNVETLPATSSDIICFTGNNIDNGPTPPGPTFKISGRLVDISNNPLSGVNLAVSGGATGNTSTDGNGNYQFLSLQSGGNFVVTPSNSTYSFSPTSQTFNNLTADRVANFVGTQTIVNITGKVTDNNSVPINNATVALTKNGVAAGSVQTNALGDYSFPNQTVGANYVVTPVGSFIPSSKVFNNLTTNVTTNFQSTPNISPQCNTTSFGSQTNFATAPGGGSHHPSVADLNGDGKADLAVPNLNTANISVLLGDGLGGFGAATNFAVGVSPQSVAIQDFNADNRPDLAVANDGSNNVSILLGTGTGSFGPAVNFAAGSNPIWIRSGDLNNDGKPDLVVANRNSNNVSILIGTGTGTFNAAVNFAVGASPRSVATGDFNVDGNLDLAVGNLVSANVSVLLGTGTGSFGTATNFAVGTNPSSVAVADFNGDGRSDLSVTNPGSQNVSVLLGTGTGSFGSATNFSTGLSEQSVVVGDINGDGRQDLVLSSSILLGTGTGSFGLPSLNLAALNAVTGDFNSDGKVDVAGASINGASVFLNNGTTCNTQTSLTISGQVKNAANQSLSEVAVTLSGPITRTVSTDVSGNYAFPNLAPGGNYAVTVQSNYYVFAPSRADLFNLSNNQTVNFNAAPNVVPLPTPTPSDNFNTSTRDPERWNLGTQTQPVGAVDPQVTTTQVNGQLVIAPRAQQVGLHYNGYVSANSFDFRNGAAGVELVQAASGGADSIFAIGSDGDNFTRFVVHTAGGPSGVVNMVRDAYGRDQPLDTSTAQLIFQVRINGDLTSISIPYDAQLHRYLRFRHEAQANAILFETSANNADYTERHRVLLQKSVSALTAELSAGTPNPTNPGQTIFDNLNLVTSTYQFSAANYVVGEGEGAIVITVTRQGTPGVSGTTATVEYQTTDGTAQQKNRYIPAVGTLTFAPGQTSRTFTVLVVDNVLTEGNQTVNLLLGNALGSGLNTPGRAVLTIVDNDTLVPTVNPVNEATFYAQQHYLDFFSRQPDPSGVAFWANEILSCGSDVQCQEVKRINVSAAFFLSIEFQQTGYLVERLYKVAYGDGSGSSTFEGQHQLAVPIIRREEFLPDTQEIGLGVVVGATGWEQKLESNTVAFVTAFVQRSRFKTAYADTLTPVQYVDLLFLHSGVTPTAGERTAVVNEFGVAQTSADVGARARALRQVAEHATLKTQEFNRAFVLMQYFGYLRRNPNGAPDANYTGYDFWLTKLNQFNGNFVNAEMVKAFITSGEYIHRFGP